MGHVEDMVDFIASLPASDRIEIVKVTYRTALTMAEAIRQENDWSDSQILAELQSAGREEIRLGA